MKISIATDYSDTPAGRYKSDGPYSGEKFRDDVLLKHLNQSDIVEIDLDGSEGYGSSFLEECFGGLVRMGLFTSEELHKKLKFNATGSFDRYVKKIWGYIDSATYGSKK